MPRSRGYFTTSDDDQRERTRQRVDYANASRKQDMRNLGAKQDSRKQMEWEREKYASDLGFQREKLTSEEKRAEAERVSREKIAGGRVEGQEELGGKRIDFQREKLGVDSKDRNAKFQGSDETRRRGQDLGHEDRQARLAEIGQRHMDIANLEISKLAQGADKIAIDKAIREQQNELRRMAQETRQQDVDQKGMHLGNSDELRAAALQQKGEQFNTNQERARVNAENYGVNVHNTVEAKKQELDTTKKYKANFQEPTKPIFGELPLAKQVQVRKYETPVNGKMTDADKQRGGITQPGDKPIVPPPPPAQPAFDEKYTSPADSRPMSHAEEVAGIQNGMVVRDDSQGPPMPEVYPQSPAQAKPASERHDRLKANMRKSLPDATDEELEAKLQAGGF